MYATASELAGYMQQDLDTYTATLALTVVSAEFSRVAVTDWTLIRRTLYRTAGFGAWYATMPPAKIEIDLTYGYAAPTDDVKGAVLECAAAIYEQPDGTVTAENIDDYAVRYMQLGRK